MWAQVYSGLGDRCDAFPIIFHNVPFASSVPEIARFTRKLEASATQYPTATSPCEFLAAPGWPHNEANVAPLPLLKAG
jgi:hypothetical protein